MIHRIAFISSSFFLFFDGVRISYADLSRIHLFF